MGAKYQTHPTDAIADTMNLYRLEMDEAAYLMTLHIKNDTLSPYVPDSLYTWISNFDSYEGDLWLAREYLAAGSPTLAAQVFNGIPSKYTLTTAQQSDLNNYAAIANLIGTTSVYELDATALTALRSYDNVGGHAEGWAQNILTWYGAHYPVEYVTSSQGEQQLIGNGQIRFQQDAVSSFKVAVFPNPANQVVNFAVEGDLSEKGEVLVVKDMHNRILTKFMVTSSESNISWDSSIYPSGLYFFQLYSNGKSIEAGKIILNK
ncbi:MAG: T9SS type A sorting domain-containing protein [Saprospiraceae bacterium]